MHKWFEVDTFEKFKKLALNKTPTDFNFRISKPVVVVRYYSPGIEIETPPPDKELNLLLFYDSTRDCYFFKERDSKKDYIRIETNQLKEEIYNKYVVPFVRET